MWETLLFSKATLTVYVFIQLQCKNYTVSVIMITLWLLFDFFLFSIRHTKYSLKGKKKRENVHENKFFWVGAFLKTYDITH